jgi:hypothetical protein
VLDAAKAKYARATWSEDGSAFAVLRGVDTDTLEQRDNVLLAFTSLGARAPVRTEIDAAAHGLPTGHVISDKATLIWAEPADRVIFGIRTQASKPKADDKNGWQKPSDVNVFHWDDDRIQTVQARQAEAERNRTDRATLLLASKTVVPLTDASLTGITFSRDGRWGIASDDRAYVSDWEESRADYYRVNTATGERTPFLNAQLRTLGISPDGGRYLYWKDDHVWAYELARDRHVNLTAAHPSVS